MRGFNYKKAAQALNYLACKNGGTLNKMKAIKLIWLADRLHTRKYGRSITGDEYYAIPYGPIPSAVRDILESSNFLEDSASDYASCYLREVNKYEYSSISEPNLKVLSETDINTINQIEEKYGRLNEFELSDLSHEFPEWKKYKSALTKRLSSRFSIDQSDFFINIDDQSGLFMDSQEDIEISKTIFKENAQILSILS